MFDSGKYKINVNLRFYYYKSVVFYIISTLQILQKYILFNIGRQNNRRNNNIGNIFKLYF